MPEKKMEVPHSFQIMPFYKEGDQLTVLEDAQVGKVPPFYFEILHYNQENGRAKWPWETENGADMLWEKWEVTKDLPERFFRNREPKKAAPYVMELAAAFIGYLFWSEGRPVNIDDKGLSAVTECHIAPVNLFERLKYVCESPHHYHAFVQLTSLFEEARKKRALYNLKRSR